MAPEGARRTEGVGRGIALCFVKLLFFLRWAIERRLGTMEVLILPMEPDERR